MATRLTTGQFIGDTRSIRVGPGAILSEVRHQSGRRLPRHSHELAFISVLLRGRYEERWAPDHVWSYAIGGGAYHPPEFTHDDEIGAGGARFLCVELEAGSLRRVAEIAPRVVEVPSRLTADGTRAAHRLFAAWRCTHQPNPLRIEGLLFELFAALAEPQRAAERRAPWLAQITDLLHDDLPRPWTVEGLAALIGRHPVHVARAFRRHHGHSIAEHQRRLRLQRACALLADDETTLADIAARTGFADQSHFARVFKAAFGMPPGRYREALRLGPRRRAPVR